MTQTLKNISNNQPVNLEIGVPSRPQKFTEM